MKDEIEHAEQSHQIHIQPSSAHCDEEYKEEELGSEKMEMKPMLEEIDSVM